MSITALTCHGELLVNNNMPQCLGNWVLTQLPEPFELTQLDPVFLTQMLLYGFASGSVLYAACFGVKAVLSMFNLK